jgi:hypothetical protein
VQARDRDELGDSEFMEGFRREVPAVHPWAIRDVGPLVSS